MKIIINNRRRIYAIEEEFNQVFPNLKIEFFAKPNKPGGVPLEQRVTPGKSIVECRAVHNEGAITITPAMTIDNLKQNFRDVYGLSVQVFKKSGEDWIETTGNGNCSLEEQNRQPQSKEDFCRLP